MSLCEKDCKYNGYNIENKKAKCECKIKEKFSLKSEFNIDKDKLVEMLNIKNSINIYVLKCFHLFFSKDGFLKNIGIYILLIIILSNIILLIVFLIKGYKELNNIIYEIVKIKYQMNENNIDKKGKNDELLNEGKSINSITIYKNRNNKNQLKDEQEISKIDKTKTNDFKNMNSNNLLNLKIEKNTIDFEKNYNKNKYFNLKYNDYEINTLNYKDALLRDNRTYIKYYISQLKRKQLLIFTFYTKDDYNSFIIKISLFLYNFSIYYFVNALFFTDSTMHKIYVEKGNYNFIYQLQNILYSTIISGVNNIIISYLSLSEKNILKIKNFNEKNNDNLNLFTSNIKKCLIIKLTFFFSLNFIFLILYWYYLGCFCAVYKNTQIHLIKDTLFSFLLTLLYPFGLSLFPGFLRITSLKSIKKDKECMYKLSKLIQLF